MGESEGLVGGTVHAGVGSERSEMEGASTDKAAMGATEAEARGAGRLVEEPVLEGEQVPVGRAGRSSGTNGHTGSLGPGT